MDGGTLTTIVDMVNLKHTRTKCNTILTTFGIYSLQKIGAGNFERKDI